MIRFAFKLLTAVFFVILFFPPADLRAEDCMHDPIYERDWNAQVTTGVRIRNIPCMETSTVLGTAPVGEVLHVIAETDGYYKVERKDGTVGWIGQWLVAQTSELFNKDAPKEPLYDLSGHLYEDSVRYLAEQGIVAGYPDGSYQPDKTVNRAEFTKIIVGAKLGTNPTAYADNCFPDVKKSDWFSGYVCYAKENGIIQGYPDGTFGPANTINLVEASKILVNTLGVENAEVQGNSPWYKPFIDALQNQGYIPATLKAFDQSVSRGEMAELIWRIRESVHTKPFSQFSF